MKNPTLLCLAAMLLAFLGSGLVAQANVVAGLDGRLSDVNNLTYYGRRGATHPNGEAGMAMLNTMCNPGTVNIPWFAAMQAAHPFFGFTVVRVANDKIEQINEWSYCKHAWLSVNVNGACGSCQQPGTGALMGINCSDTYGAGNNADRHDLAPPWEIDPWLGTWQPTGSYFDIGDPNQPGFPAAADGIRSLNTAIFSSDPVEHRVTVDEVDLLTPNALYYYGLQLVIGTEAVANRDDNLAHRGFSPTWNGSQWSFSNTAPQAYGSILDRWPGAEVSSGQNGYDDGRFFVAVKATAIGGGLYHYEYAVHNVDNSRAAATFRLPIAATATATNFTFGDLDSDSSNDWTAARIGNEIVFAATATNPLEWNTIYNFGFDADIAPGTGDAHLDEARPGPGALTVDVSTKVPGGLTIANFAVFGAGCDGSTVVPVPPCAQWNPAGGTLTAQTSGDEHIYRVGSAGTVQVLNFDIWTASTGGSVTVPAHIYPTAGTGPGASPIATTTITIGATPGFYRATFASPVTVSGNFYIGFDNTAQNTYLSNLQTGQSFLAYSRSGAAAAWTLSLSKPAWVVNCQVAPIYEVPSLASIGLPVLGTSYDVTLADALPASWAVLVSGLSATVYQGTPLPLPLPGAPGCEVLVSPEIFVAVATSATGTASSTITVPNSPSLNGFVAFHQWGVLDPAANAAGLALSNAASITVGN